MPPHATGIVPGKGQANRTRSCGPCGASMATVVVGGDLGRDVDAAIMFPGATPAHPAYAALQDWLREGRGRTVHFQVNPKENSPEMKKEDRQENTRFGDKQEQVENNIQGIK